MIKNRKDGGRERERGQEREVKRERERSRERSREREVKRERERRGSNLNTSEIMIVDVVWINDFEVAVLR